MFCNYRPGRRVQHWLSVFALLTLSLPLANAQAQTGAGSGSAMARPAFEDLLPETTVVFAEIRDIRDLYEKLQRSNLGKLLSDEAIAPLADDLYGQAIDAFNEFSENNEIGLTMEEIQSLPGGAINIAVIAPKRQTPVFLFTFEFDEENETFDKALDIAREAAIQDGAELENSTVEEVEFTTINNGDDRVTYFRKDGLLVASNDEAELTAYLDRWMGREVEKTRPLSANRKFITIMNRCRGSEELPPDVRFYVDPIELARSGFRGNAGAQVAINLLPALGVDGLLALGGATTLFEGEFESVFHGHVLLANPRKGVFDMIALKPGDYQPQAWIPEDSALYVSTSWDVKKMVYEIEQMVDMFQGEGQFEEEVIGNINSEMGEGFFEDLLDTFSGRFTFIQWVPEDSKAFNAEVAGFGIGIREDGKWESIRDRILAKIEEEAGEENPIVEKEYQGVSYWTLSDEIADQQRSRANERLQRDLNEGDEDNDVNIEFNAPRPAVGIIGDDLVITVSPSLMERAIDTYRGDARALQENETYQSVARTIAQLAGSDMPSVVLFQQPEKQLKHYYQLARGDDARNLLDRFSGENKYVAGVGRALDDHPLPPFEDLQKYFTPNGTFITNDDTGYHMFSFQMLSKAGEDE